jgi:hypothetical protein
MDQAPNEKTNIPSKPPFPAVPTTKVLAIGRFLEPRQPEKTKAIFQREVPETVLLYLAEKLTSGGFVKIRKVRSS